MEKTYPELSSELHSNPKHSLNPSDSSLSVIVWDHRRSRLELITRLIAECGVRSRWIESLEGSRQIECSLDCPIALVALGTRPSASDLGLEIIRTLKQKGFKVICYEDSAQTWPLGLKCQPLLAGSSKLLLAKFQK